MSVGSEFSADVASKPYRRGSDTRRVRLLIYAHLIAAVLTASYQIDVVSGGLIREFGWNPEDLSVPAFFTVFLFPPLVFFTARRGGLQGTAFCWAVLSTLALGVFQCNAIGPAIQ